LSAIEPYALPSRHDLPTTRLPWQPELRRSALLVHDMQSYFLRFYRAEQSPMREVLNNIRRLARTCREAGVPVIYSAQPADPAAADRKLLGDLWGPGLTAFPQQAGIVPELAPEDGDLVLAKTRYSAFHGTALAETLRARGRDQLWIVGVYGHIGCMITAFDAFMRDVQPFLVFDAIMDFSPEHHQLAARLVSERCGVVLESDTLLRALGQRGAERPRADARTALLEALAPILSLEPSDLVPEAELRDLGLDSVRMLELFERLRERGLELESVDLLECQRVDQLLTLIARAPLHAGHARAHGVVA
ncbi:MAG TPA: isochorismatase family protein, partial [Polyangiales bacterium]